MSLDKPQWINSDIKLFMKLYYHKLDRELTPKEKEFCRTMSIMEQYAVGLDGD